MILWSVGKPFNEHLNLQDSFAQDSLSYSDSCKGLDYNSNKHIIVCIFLQRAVAHNT